MSNHDKLVKLLVERSARRGSFVLASGRQSSLYIDARMTAMSPEGLPVIGTEGLEFIMNSGWNVDAIGGLTLGADPISYAISYASSGSDRPLRAFTVRKEAKEHGTSKLIEGPFRAGDRVAVIEDVITTGGSALKATRAVEQAGGVVAGILALVDRQEGGRENIESAGYRVHSLITASELLEILPA